MEYGRQIFKFENGWAYINVDKRYEKAKVHQSSFVFEPLEYCLTSESELKAFETICNETKQFRLGQLSDLLNGVDVDIVGLKGDDEDGWATVFAELAKAEEYFDSPQLQESSPQSLGNTHNRIPQTRLRRFYETLRFFRIKNLSSAIAEYLSAETAARADHFTKIVDQSIIHFEQYANTNEGFRPIRRMHAIDQYTTENKPYAKCLQARIKNGQGISFSHESAPNLQYIDYEISPLRQQGGVMDDGQIGTSGTGGLDLLLVDCSDSEAPVLVIGEVKATTDTDLFLAFVQALMYAVEFGSENQIARICNQSDYPPILQKLDVNTGLDIYLIYERKRGASQSDDGLLYKQTMKFCTNLMGKERAGSRLQKLIRQIKFVEAKLREGEGVEFNVVGQVCREHQIP